ncbi:uncharacterized protein LOC110835244 [Zootermopsis nevadensis]|uniref:Apoptosis regulator BAX n=1 Tax=Zootermopsis nevadensis TaxID=136037 RepID=A0A067QWK2_ZOONE|nr:uncharacterized protein LOC110835244 [Zootermopsis nevadensis]KDR13623.1 Apoptosis regulator BAX [Zootermopsis nevadensis]
MVQPIVRSHSDQEQEIEESTDAAVHPQLDDSGVRHSNAEDHLILPEDGELEGAVGYSPNARAIPEFNNMHAERRQSYWEGYSGSVAENRSLCQRRHSSGELSGRRWPYENYVGQSLSNQFGPGERRASTQLGPHERRSSNSWNITEILNHNHNQFAAQYVYPPGIPRETVLLGSQLYIRFLYDEILRLNLQAPEYLNPNNADPPLRNNDINCISQNLRQLANEFAQSELRHRVQERAESACLENLNFTTFSDLLFGLFQEGGVTSERVIVLFFFCSDLAIRALRNSLRDIFYLITYWSQRYIIEKLSVWVQEHGGWVAVLQESMNHAYKIAVITFCCFGIVAMCVYIRNNTH